MTPEDILTIINSIPEYIEYIYPGYLAIFLYLFFKGKTIKDNSYIIIKSIAISYVCIVFKETCAEILHLEFLKIPYALKENICLIILSIGGAYILHLLTSSNKVQEMLNKIGIDTTFYDNEIEALSDFGKGAWLCVYLKNDKVVYEGSLGNKELEEGKRKYICLDAYYKYFLDEEEQPIEPYIEDHEGNYKETVMIFYDDIKRIERRAVD